MTNIIEFSASDSSRGEALCWLCQRTTSMRSLFCHNCGAIQPVRAIDHFARLGLDRRIDLDLDLLERQYAALNKTLDPERFSIRGLGERGHAAKQLEALKEAYITLRDPVRRGRYWLVLHQLETPETADTHPMVDELRGELEMAAEVSQCDRVAHRAGQALEQGIMGFMQALRAQQWQQANAVLMVLDGLEIILGNVRDRRAQMVSSEPAGNGISCFKAD